MSETTHPSPGRSAGSQFLGSEQLVLALILAALCIAISIAAPQFYSEANIIAILRQCALVLIVASGMTMLIITAEVDLSVGASLAFVGCIIAALNATHSLALGFWRAARRRSRPINGLVAMKLGELADRHDRYDDDATGRRLSVHPRSVQNYHIAAHGSRRGYVGPIPVP